MSMNDRQNDDDSEEVKGMRANYMQSSESYGENQNDNRNDENSDEIEEVHRLRNIAFAMVNKRDEI